MQTLRPPLLTAARLGHERLELAQLGARHKRDRHAARAEAPRAADAVHVRRGVGRHVGERHEVGALEVDAARHHVGRDDGAQLERAQRRDDCVALELRQVGGQRRGGEAGGRQAPREPLGGRLAVAEDDGLVERRRAEQPQDRVGLGREHALERGVGVGRIGGLRAADAGLVATVDAAPISVAALAVAVAAAAAEVSVVDEAVELAHAAQRDRLLAQQHLLRPARERLEVGEQPRRVRRREREHLLARRQLRVRPRDVAAEALAEQRVGLVEHEQPQRARRQRARREQRAHAAGRADGDVARAAQALLVVRDRQAADKREALGRRRGQRGRDAPHDVGALQRDLARRREHERLRQRRGGVDAAQRDDREDARLAGARLGLHEQVAADAAERDREALHRRRPHKARGGERLDERRRQQQVGKGAGVALDVAGAVAVRCAGAASHGRSCHGSGSGSVGAAGSGSSSCGVGFGAVAAAFAARHGRRLCCITYPRAAGENAIRVSSCCALHFLQKL